MMSRVVQRETRIGSKVLKPGNFILMPSRQLHTNEDVWGDDVRQFDPQRFLKKKSLLRHSSYRPFGGGLTYCPGRILVKHEVFGFIAILLHRFNISLVCLDGEKPMLPRLNDTIPGLGISGPIQNTDILVHLEHMRD